MRLFFRYLLRPLDPERVALLATRRKDYPPHLLTEDQSIGRYNIGCGATHGVMERCNFGCTACYLGSRANHQPPMPFAEVEKQLTALRAQLGPGANVQITSGEVTLLPVDDLVRIVGRARGLRLSPMVMTHGDILLHDPAYLDKLVLEGGLDKLSVHVDITQRGRKGVSRVDHEADLNPVRDKMARLLRDCARRTGRRIKAATTLTVNSRNLPQLTAPVQWFLANTDAFRLLSFQPQADTGRTASGDGVSAARVWAELEAAAGMPLEPHSFSFGHPDCNRICVLVRVETPAGSFLLQTVRPGNECDRAFVGRVLDDFGGIVLASVSKSEGLGRILGRLLQKPAWFLRLPIYVLKRTWQERRLLPSVLWGLLRFQLKIQPLAFVVHAFMSREELTTDLGKERLAACTFKLAVNGKLVSMCEMNGTDLRESTYEAMELPN
ncbi:MAG: radical SAM protein [Acidobacteriota bacterium]|nr:radical SAM protein [Acidobacteriota bacterium]